MLPLANSSAITLGLFFLVLVLVFERFEQLGGWTIAEVAFLFGMVETAFGIMDMVFSGFDPANFGRQVRRGTFDQLLLRPVDLTLQVLGSQFVLRRLGRILEGAAILGYALILLDVQWTAGKVLYLPVVLLSQVAFFGGLFMVGATIPCLPGYPFWRRRLAWRSWRPPFASGALAYGIIRVRGRDA